MIGPNFDIFSGQSITKPNNPENDQDEQLPRSIRDMKMIRLRRSHYEPAALDKKEFPMIRLRRNYLDYDYENLKTKRGGNLKLMRL